LYSALARERPLQILAVFIRDVSTIEGEPLTDPTGSKWQEGLSDDILRLVSNPNAFDPNATQRPPPPVSYAQRVPARKSSSMSTNSMQGPIRRSTASSGIGEPSSYASSLITEEPQPIARPRMDQAANANGYATPSKQGEGNLNAQLQGLPLHTRRRIELQLRVNRARDEIPPHVKLRVFKNPLECTEAEEILYNLRL